MDEFIRLEQLAFQYESPDEPPKPALKGIDLTLKRGSFVAVVGHNGCGKSTLAKHLNAILLPTAGRVLVDGMDTADEDKRLDIRRTVAMVLQNPDNQIVSSIVEEDVAFGPENLGVPPQEIRQRVDDALRTVGMYDCRHQAPSKLSGGQKQRVAIAGALAMQPACLVLDEPTAMLDPAGRAEVLETVTRLNRERGMTVVLITHYMEEAAQADRVIVMDGGQVLLDGTPREVFVQTDVLQKAALDVPPVTGLCNRLREQGAALPPDVLTEEECIAALTAAIQAQN